MNESEEYNLIDGTFSPVEAEKLLGAMVKGKIDFHSLQRHSEVELSGEAAGSAQRLEQLKVLEADLRKFFVEAKKSGKELKVSGRIEIAAVD